MEELAQLLLLLIVLGIVLAYARGGAKGVRDWWSVKLIGVPA